ncbi:DUF4010 domain-containing protein [Sediminimonas sp.]|uniref:MgtC/SapB family protein n=1 Tax=Sediminimonas sp. TaxID=2823379 RepID=UPI0025F9967F|nr:DUF4010 domain-containing protein [Sediminimonas sp.]
MGDVDLFMRFGLALAIGLLFGVERGWQGRGASEGARMAGIRTFALTALLGAVTGWLATLAAPVVLGLGFAGLAALVAVGHWAGMRADDDRGITTEVAMLLVFGLGAAAVLGAMAPVAVVAVVATLLLSMKRRLHGLVAGVEQLELDALLRLAVLSVAVLPLLPDRGFGPGGVLNPYQIWWAVVIVAGLSFFGYVAIRLAGARIGVLATGLFGGLASSTSTTVALARLARQNAALVPLAATGTVLAGSVTFLRILVLVAVFEPRLVMPLALPMAAMAAAGFAAALVIHSLAGSGDATDAADRADALRNPLELGAALMFGAVLAVVIVATHYLEGWLGARGVYAAAALSGVTDVDAMTISVARLVGADFTPAQGAVAVFVTAAVNTAVKGGLSFAAGSAGLGWRVALAYVAVLGVGGLALWWG